MQSIRAIACLSGLAAAAWAQSEDIVHFPVCLQGAEGELVFTAERSSVLEAGNGYFVNGTLYLQTPLIPMPIPKAEAYFEKDPGANCMHTARGRAVPPTPISDTPLQSAGPVAEFGIDLGANLQQEFGIGLIAKRQYLFFNLDTGFDLQTVAAAEEDENAEPQAFQMQSGGPTSKAKLLLDPLDPFYYVSGSVITAKKQPKPAKEDEDSKLVEFGTGASWQGLIPFRPTTTYGIENKAREFFGHRIKSGSFELLKMPVRITGYMVENINPLGHEKPAVDMFGIGYGPEAQMGANGIFDLSFKLLKSDKLKFLKSLDDIRLGTASAAFEVVQGAQYAYISGVFAPKPGNTFSKFIKLEAELKAMAYLSTAIDDTALAMNGLLYIAPGEFSQMAGISLNNFVHGQGSLTADRNGLFVKLLLENGSSLGPLSYRGRAQAELAVPSEEPENAALQIQGDTTFSGVTTTGITRISRNGLELTGRTTAPVMELTAAFRPDPTGILIEGSTTVPAAVNTQIAAEITRTAAQVQSDLDKLLSDLEKATKDLEFEVSLRGLRSVIPGACDAVIRTLDARLRSEFNEAWPQIYVPFRYVDAPGKDAIWTIVNGIADDYRQRIRVLKATVQRGDDAAVRAALKTAINEILANRRLRIEVTVPVVNRRITFYNVELINDTLAAQLVTARTAVDRIPAVSNIRVSAQQAWTSAPKRAILLQVSKQIQQGVSAAMPRIESLRFQTRPATTEWKFTAITVVGGQRHNLTLTVPATDIANIGRAAGRELARIL